MALNQIFRNNSLKLRIIMLVILTLVFVLSSAAKKNTRRKYFKTALVNPKYENEISYIHMQDSEKSIVLQKVSGLWCVSAKDTMPLPANTKMIEAFLKELTKIREVYAVSEKPDYSDFNLNPESPDFISISYSAHGDFVPSETSILPASSVASLEHEKLMTLIFGKYDFSGINRYFTNASGTVYETDSDIDEYLSLSVQFWSEPYIISRVMTGIPENSIQTVKITSGSENAIYFASEDGFSEKWSSLIELRHGGAADLKTVEELITDSENKNHLLPEFSADMDLGSKERLHIDFFRIQDSAEKNPAGESFIAKITYDVSKKFRNASNSSDNKNSSENKNGQFVFYEKISLWTYNRLLENLR